MLRHAVLADPTPAGDDHATYFGADYRELAGEPLIYGYYRCRFMADVPHRRGRLGFGRMLLGKTR